MTVARLLRLSCAVLFPAIVLATGCRDEIATKRIDALEEQVRSVEEKVKSVAEKNITQDGLKLLQDIKQSVILRPGDQGFKTLSYELGVLTLRLSNIEPYGNGTRVHLQIGNPSAATVDDVSAKVHWGSNDLDPSSIARGYAGVQQATAGG